MQHKKHLFFDLDGTLTPSRQRIKPDMAALLPTLGRTIVVVSGSMNLQIQDQVGDLTLFSLGQNGNQAIDPSGALLWENVLSPEDTRAAMEHIARIRPLLTHPIPDETDLIEDRGSQISFSIYGHHAPAEEKRACDGDFKKRRALLADHPFVSDTMEVQIGGSTCFDYFRKGFNKGTNVQRLIDVMGWEKDTCVYFGDALFPGGNDATVLDVIETVSVRDEDDTLRLLTEYFT